MIPMSQEAALKRQLEQIAQLRQGRPVAPPVQSIPPAKVS